MVDPTSQLRIEYLLKRISRSRKGKQLIIDMDEVLEHGVVEGGELGQGLDELQAVLPLTVQDQLHREGRWKEI